MIAAHVTAGAEDSTRPVIDDAERRDLIACLKQAFGDGLLAYCVLDTHVHAVVEGSNQEAALRGEFALRIYLRAFARRRGRPSAAPRLRGPVVALPVWSERELARTIHYVHENPVDTRTPLARRPIDYPWSSARSFAGLCLAPVANVARARALLGRHAWRVALPGPPAATPTVRPEAAESPSVLLAAAAEAYGLDPREVAGRGLATAAVAARRLFVRLGIEAQYRHRQLAPVLRRTRVRVSQIAAEPPGEEALRVARALMADPTLRAELRRTADRILAALADAVRLEVPAGFRGR